MTLRKARVSMLRLVLCPIVIAGIFFGRPPGAVDTLGVSLVEFAGYMLLLIGLGIRLWAILYIGQRKSKELIADGPYSVCRNPLYVGTFAIVPGIALCFENIPLAILAFAISVAVHYFVVLGEERRLTELFGDAYHAYCREVPRFLPSLRHYHSPERFEVSARGIRRAILESIPVLLVPPLAELVEALQAQHILPILWKMPWL
ncbi:MAG: isoprenylcysteine carboxylmethyltransferase family protein [Phycisphaerae bacterium]|nr:isoprenylcysteine carboxylmethyltransferase family protein [Phycisphaerae bacterium]